MQSTPACGRNDRKHRRGRWNWAATVAASALCIAMQPWRHADRLPLAPLSAKDCGLAICKSCMRELATSRYRQGTHAGHTHTWRHARARLVETSAAGEWPRPVLTLQAGPGPMCNQVILEHPSIREGTLQSLLTSYLITFENDTVRATRSSERES